MATNALPDTPLHSTPDGAGRNITLGEHLLEARNRLTIAVVTVMVTTAAALIFGNTILEYMTGPGRAADPDFRPIFTEVLGFFSAYVKIGLLLGVAAAMPMILYQAFMFINPALTRQERRWVLPIIIGATASFAGGGAFAYYVAWPPALDFLLNFGDSVADPQIRINNYIDTLTRFMFWTGVVFEMPLVLMGLGVLGLTTARQLLRAWRWALIGSFVLSALITPSVDPVTQTAVAVPLIILWLVGTALVRLVENRGLNAQVSRR